MYSNYWLLFFFLTIVLVGSTATPPKVSKPPEASKPVKPTKSSPPPKKAPRPPRSMTPEGAYIAKIKACRRPLKLALKSSNLFGTLLAAGFHDAATFNKYCKEPWPLCGGANGNLHYPAQYNRPENEGLRDAIIVHSGVKKQCSNVSWADLIQMGAGLAVEMEGGPSMKLKYGRKDAPPDKLDPEGNLPEDSKPFADGSVDAAEHLRRVFDRLGFEDKDIVALAGRRTIGRTFTAPGAEMWTNYTFAGPGKVGGSSWTPNWLTFDNSIYRYIKTPSDPELILLESDKAIFKHPEFSSYAESFLNNKTAFFQAFTESYIKLSELGVEWIHGSPLKA